jgi:hypothetical protein
MIAFPLHFHEKNLRTEKSCDFLRIISTLVSRRLVQISASILHVISQFGSTDHRQAAASACADRSSWRSRSSAKAGHCSAANATTGAEKTGHCHSSAWFCPRSNQQARSGRKCSQIQDDRIGLYAHHAFHASREMWKPLSQPHIINAFC